MKGLTELIKTALIGGLLVILPIYLSILLVAKLLASVLALLSPVTAAIPASAQFRQMFAIVIVLAVCLVVGLLVRTNVGLRAKNAFEHSVLKRSRVIRWCETSPNGYPVTRPRVHFGRHWWNWKTRSRPPSSSRS